MAAMRRVALYAALALAAAACRGGAETPPASPAVAPTPSPTPSASPTASPIPRFSPPPSPSPTPNPVVKLPADAPTEIAVRLAPEEVPVEWLIPPGAQATASWVLARPGDAVSQVAVAWARGDDPFAREHGYVVWQRLEDAAPPWRAVYAYTDPPAEGVLGIRLQVHDLTGDGVDDALTFEETGGSGACGTWRVVETGPGFAAQIFKRRTCDTDIQTSGGSLVIREAVYEPDDPHCCPSAYRTTTLAWNGVSWDVVSRDTTPV